MVKSISENAPKNNNQKKRKLDRPKLDRRKRLPKGSANKSGAGVLHGGLRKIGRLSGTQAVILIGFMGAGKSSVGRALAGRLGWAFEDLDDLIERREKRKIADIFSDSGEAEFRRMEHAALKELLAGVRAGAQLIIGLGGGAFVQKANTSLIEAVKVPTVMLDAGVDELWERCKRQSAEQGTERPLRGSLENFRELYEKRRPHYLRASLRQETAGTTVEQIVIELIQVLGLH